MCVGGGEISHFFFNLYHPNGALDKARSWNLREGTPGSVVCWQRGGGVSCGLSVQEGARIEMARSVWARSVAGEYGGNIGGI